MPTALAEGHRARLAKDAERFLSSGDAATAAVIVSGSANFVDGLAARHGLGVAKRLRHGVVLHVTRDQLDALASDSQVASISLDTPVASSMAVSTTATGADQAWAGVAGLSGITGRGVTVAVIDSGVAEHRDLREQVVAHLDFTTAASARGIDHFGHGTHIAGIIAGKASDGSFRGMAPGARLINLRVMDAEGTGSTSDVIRAIDWAVENASLYGIRVINLSLGHPVMESWRDDPLVARPRWGSSIGSEYWMFLFSQPPPFRRSLTSTSSVFSHW